MEDFNHPEQIILQVAEEEFIKKGFHGAKTIVMARKAGVTLATFHGYFKTKEDLFQIVFLKKVQMVAVSLLIYEEGYKFEDTIKSITEHHFDLVAQNPELVNFIYNEIVSNKDNRKLLAHTLSSRLRGVYVRFARMVENEIAEGRIISISPMDLIMDLLSLNVFPFMMYSMMMKVFMPENGQKDFDAFIKNRKESNVQFLLNALKPQSAKPSNNNDCIKIK